MNLVWHQFRKDVRQFRMLLAMWFTLVALDLAVSLGWVGNVGINPATGFDQISSLWTGLQTFCLWLMAAVLPALVVLADSPARREGFLSTRPLPKRDLYAAKALFAAVLVMAPMVVQEGAHLALRGLTFGQVVHGMADRLLIMFWIVAGMGAFAALWASYGRWVAGVAISLAGVYVIALTGAFLGQFVYHLRMDLFHLNRSQAMAGQGFGVLALLLLAIWHSRKHPRPLWKWVGLAVVAAGAFLAGLVWPWDFLRLRPGDPAAAAAIVSASPLQVPLQNIKAVRQQNISDRTVQANQALSLQPQYEPPRAGHTLEWAAMGSSFVRASGQEISLNPGGRLQPIFVRYSSYGVAKDINAWASLLSSNALVNAGNYYSDNDEFPLGLIDLARTREWLGETVRLQARLEARVFRWEPVADLPLAAGQSATDAYGTWTCLAVHSRFVPGRGIFPGVEVLLQRAQVEFANSRDPNTDGSPFWPQGKVAVVLYNPAREMALLPDNPYYVSLTRAAHTACPQYYLHVQFVQELSRKAPSPEEMARCRLRIFRKTWLGSVPQPWQSAPFVLGDIVSRGGSSSTGNDPMPRGEFVQRVNELPVPSANASRPEVCLYLLELLRLVEAHRAHSDAGDPAVSRLAALVPAHLDILLDGLPVMEASSRRAVLQAISRGATPEQKAQLIAALPRNQSLAAVLLARGWVEEARPQLYQFLDAPHQLFPEVIRSLAWFEDPKTYPRLVAELSTDRSGQIYDALRNLPGIEPQLDAEVDQLWRHRSRIIRTINPNLSSPYLKLALHHGKPEALELAYRILRELGSEESGPAFDLTEVLWDTVQMPGLRREDGFDPTRIMGWLKKYRADDFVFDPARRKFVLKTGVLVADPAGATTGTFRNQATSAKRP